MSAGPKRYWLQFTLHGALTAIAWLGVLLAACVVSLDDLPNDAARFVLIALRVVPLFTAIGALFGRALAGTFIGGIAYLILLGGFAAYAQSTGIPWTFF